MKRPDIYKHCETVDFINKYYEGILPESSSKEMQITLIREAQAGSIDARNLLIEKFLRFIYKIANKNWQQFTELDDLFQVGVIGCIKAINTFNVEYEYAFMTYAGIVISNEIKMYIRALKLDKISSSLDEPISSTDKGEAMFLLDILEDPNINHLPEECLDAIVTREIILEEVNKLPEKERSVVEYYFGINGKPRIKQQQLADMFGYSQVWICRLIKGALKSIRKNVESSFR